MCHNATCSCNSTENSSPLPDVAGSAALTFTGLIETAFEKSTFLACAPKSLFFVVWRV